MPLTIEDRKELDESMERTLIRLLVRSSSINEAFTTAIDKGFSRAFPKQVKELSDALAATLLPELEAKIAEGVAAQDSETGIAELVAAVQQLSIDIAVLGVAAEEPVEDGAAGKPDVK